MCAHMAGVLWRTGEGGTKSLLAKSDSYRDFDLSQGGGQV